MTWNLYLDDIRHPPNNMEWTLAKSSMEAILLVDAIGMPKYMSLDHDLGGEDNTMIFLKALYQYWIQKDLDASIIPGYIVHSANPIGTKNIISFMESWKKSTT